MSFRHSVLLTLSRHREADSGAVFSKQAINAVIHLQMKPQCQRRLRSIHTWPNTLYSKTKLIVKRSRKRDSNFKDKLPGLPLLRLPPCRKRNSSLCQYAQQMGGSSPANRCARVRGRSGWRRSSGGLVGNRKRGLISGRVLSALSVESWPTGQANVSRKDAEPQREKRGKEKLSALATLREISFFGFRLVRVRSCLF